VLLQIHYLLLLKLLRVFVLRNQAGNSKVDKLSACPRNLTLSKKTGAGAQGFLIFYPLDNYTAPNAPPFKTFEYLLYLFEIFRRLVPPVLPGGV
jgi:hypothetical protein